MRHILDNPGRLDEYTDYLIEAGVLRSPYSWQLAGIRMSFFDTPDEDAADIILKWHGWADCYAAESCITIISAANFSAGDFSTSYDLPSDIRVEL